MKSPTLFYNKALIKNDLRRFGLVGFCYFFLMMLITNVGALNLMLEPYEVGSDVFWNVQMYFPNPYDYFGAFLMAFGLGIALFRYSHNGNAITAMHGMPVSRKQIFFGRYIVFSILYVIPILLNSLISMGLIIGRGYPLGQVFSYVGIVVLSLIVAGYTLFGMTVMVGMLTGSDIFQGVMTLIGLVLPVAFLYMLRFLASVLIEGLPVHQYHFPFWYLLAPGYSMAMMLVESIRYFEWFLVLIVMAYGIVFNVLAYVCYRKRDLENHHKIIVFEWAKKVFIAMMASTIIISLCALFANLVTDGNQGIYIAIVPSALIGYGLSKMIVERTLAIYKYYKGLLITVALSVLLVIAVDLDVVGYQNHIPDSDEILSVQYSRNGYMSIDDFVRDYEDSSIELNFNDTLKFEDAESIEIIRKVHQEAIDQKSLSNESGWGINIVYWLKNGKVVQRVYDDYDLIQYEQAIYESAEYKNDYIAKMYAIIDETRGGRINPGFGRDTISIEPSLLKSLVSAYEIDFRDQSYYEMWRLDRVANIQISDNNDDVFVYNFPVRAGFSNTLKWLEDNGIDIQIPTSEGLTSAVIYKRVNSEPTFFSPSTHRLIDELTNASNAAEENVQVLDTGILEGLINLGSDAELPRDDSYQIHYTYEDGYHYSVTLSELPAIYEDYVNCYSE